TGGTAAGKHGSALGAVKALPDGKTLVAGSSASSNEITASTDLAFQVSVEDSGDFQEFNVGVTLTIQKSPKPIVLRKKIPVINAGETKTVTFTNIDINGLFGLPTTVKVDIEPVPGETTVTKDTAVSKTSLVRYDAYEGAGGHQSSSIALLDAGRSGVVLSAIQGRDYARIYVKELDRGRPSVALSPEEEEAVERAMAG